MAKQALSMLIGICLLLSVLPLSLSAQEGAAEGATEHIIQPGETLSEIAAQYGLSMQTLMDANGIVDPDTIVIGQNLRIPDAPSATDAGPDEAEAEAVEEGQTVATGPVRATAAVDQIATLNSRYTVQSGDNIGLIALRMGVDVDALIAINKLPTEGPVGLVAGETLILPAMAEELRFAPPGIAYTVQPGDVLGTIANDHGITMDALMEANFISDPNLVTVGETLVIPPPVDEEDGGSVQIGPPRRGFHYYTVQYGDTLSEIAKAFDTTMLALLEFNNLPNEETVYRGLDLSIPYGPPNIPQRLSPAPLSGTSFLVSLSRQECWLFEGGRVKERWICSTGYGDWITRTGTFHVKSKIENAQSSAYELDMPYWLGLYDVGDFENGIHGLPVEWKTGEKIWDGLIGQPATFGCAMLDDEDAIVLFDAAYLGMPVHVMQ